MSIETVARRYATALADVVIKTGEIETVRIELKAWEDLISGSDELAGAFGNPSIPVAKKQAVLDGVIQKVRSSKATSNFLRVLLQNGRLADLAAVRERFESVLDERGGVVLGEVISAYELENSAKIELTTNLEKLTRKSVKLSFEIDQEIIGGVITRVGSTVYDNSVRTQLANLRQELMDI